MASRSARGRARHVLPRAASAPAWIPGIQWRRSPAASSGSLQQASGPADLGRRLAVAQRLDRKPDQPRHLLVRRRSREALGGPAQLLVAEHRPDADDQVAALARLGKEGSL